MAWSTLDWAFHFLPVGTLAFAFRTVWSVDSLNSRKLREFVRKLRGVLPAKASNGLLKEEGDFLFPYDEDGAVVSDSSSEAQAP